ncbi:hypothetical protein FIBSPDRAFT_866813 [Athelia psychrophila]|uniref:Uncharacterized protein n=1 Tax=Athelia psychrophila TaxID=1759441 RepID=A0A166EF12_9AGAM|nr:hypothetical protein FIBSPDRAFT_866813 [Fibularhizoctonia sp. CBS 109695]
MHVKTTLRDSSQGLSNNGAEGPNVDEVASRARIECTCSSAKAMHNCFSGKMRETRCDGEVPAAHSQYLSTHSFTATDSTE